ncbi:uncharacterized protein LOC132936437 [Metopolophium dirhodum]|uniref:uncharacterized protein LOC132936437 n=1 Tax=Metopolophium dirhodum TaxID=44670 RepID=UPI00298FF5BD|nr:uncharacterized protein LOC132936437 [Metopolophium dirhodum]
MSEPKTKETPTYAFGTEVWVKVFNCIWWPGIVVDPLKIPQEILVYFNNVEHIAVVKFEHDNKHVVVGRNDQIFLYSCDRKIEFVEKGLSLLKQQEKGQPIVKHEFNMNNFKKDVISMERLLGGDMYIFENLEKKRETLKSIMKEPFTQTNTKNYNTMTYKPTTSTGHSCQSQVGCNFTTIRSVNLKQQMAIDKNETDVVMTNKSSTNTISNKRKDLKTESEVKKQKLVMKDEELNTSKDNTVQLSNNVTESSINEEVVETTSAVGTLDQINNFENSLSCISSNINNSDANILIEDNNGIGVSELREYGSPLIKGLLGIDSLYYNEIVSNDVDIPLVENMSIETEDLAIVVENTNGKEKVSNDVEVNQLNGTTVGNAMPIENSCSVDSTSNKIDCEDEITKINDCLIDGVPNAEWTKEDGWESKPSALREGISLEKNILKTNQKIILHNDCEDVKSINGIFSWKLIEGNHVPYIIRVINGEHLKFVSVQMATTLLRSNNLHADIYTYASVRSHFITDSEANLLNEINRKHADSKFGKGMFLAGKDRIVRLEDVNEYYTFIKICYKQLLGKSTSSRKEKCGFIRINSDRYVPYCVKDNRIYVPLFCFEGEILVGNLRHDVIEIENWDLAYLKFCCKVQGIRDYLFASDSCTVTTLDNIKNNFPRETIFEDYWPSNRHNSHLLVDQDNSSTHTWIRAPPEIEPAENTIPHTLTAPGPAIPQTMSVMNTYQIGWRANQMGSTMSQCSSLINNTSNIVPSLPLVSASNTAPVIGNTISYSNIEPPTLQQLNALSNDGPTEIVPATEIIDLTSPLSIPVPPTVQENSLPFERELTRIPRRMRARAKSRHPYKIQCTTLQGRLIYCINAKAFVLYSNWMVTIDNLVQTVLPTCTVEKCAQLLNKVLKTKIFYGNPKQLAVLKKNGLIRSMVPGETPMVMLHDIKKVLLKLQTLECYGFTTSTTRF